MDYIHIKGYKSIKDAKIDLAPINILIGANGSGKTNFLSFIDLLHEMYMQKLKQHISLNGRMRKFLHKGTKETDEIFFKTEFDKRRNGYSVTLKAGKENYFVVTNEHLSYQGKEFNIADNETEIRLIQSDSYRAPYIKKYISNIRKYHFHDTGPKSPFMNASDITQDIYYLYKDGHNLAAFLYHIKSENKIVYNDIIETIQSIAPYFLDFYFPPEENPDVKKFWLLWRDRFSDGIFNANDFSDGTIRFIALTTIFRQPKLPHTIVVDEPELGLHPDAIAKLAGMIQSAAAQNCQVIIATQSTDLISHFNADDIITVDLKDGESVFTRLSKEKLKEWLEDYTIGDLWKRNIIDTGQPNF